MISDKQNNRGYSLLEAVVALALFMLLIVPLIGRFSNVSRINKGRNLLTATCLLEQEAELIRFNPYDVSPSKRRKLSDQEWIVKTSVKGQELKEFLIEARLNDKKVSELFFYVYAK